MTKRISKKEGLELLKSAGLLELGRMADSIRKGLHHEGIATFVVDRNINYTNICINRCNFCAFWKEASSPDAYVIGMEELYKKIQETIGQGGTQILLQGGLNPELDMDYYLNLLRAIKGKFRINVHGFSPPEIIYMAEKSCLTVRETLMLLKDAGLDSIPGGGAEILSDRVRKVLSPKKIMSSFWLKVMHEAHRLGMRTTATMMFGSIERPEDIIEHLESVRALQDKTGGFTAFIPWPFQPGNTAYASKVHPATAVEYLRVLSISRLYLDNIPNIQASWVTQGIRLAQVALRFGANDLGSTMLEENVVSAAGIRHIVSKEDIISAIRGAGFIPAQRDTYYNLLKRYQEA
ncbi:MAG: cyclic dehypoxanthinyl futalosine synthase [Thermodesulfovibrionales bacterium]|nr:cyclic dehypoxanthinyl futalosine synthase [Thermodesulfovibrionales bacterium]